MSFGARPQSVITMYILHRNSIRRFFGLRHSMKCSRNIVRMTVKTSLSEKMPIVENFHLCHRILPVRTRFVVAAKSGEG